MANKKINELATRTPSLTDLLLVGDPSSGYSYKATITAVSNVIETSISNSFVTLATTQTISGAKTFSNTITATSVANAPSNTGKFLVLNASNVINYRTSAEVLSDIGAQGSITLTTTGSSGAATLVGNTLNIPNYGSALSGYVPTTRTLTINGTAYDLSADRTWSVGTVTSVAATAGTGISISGSPITSSGTLTITNTAPDQVVALTAGTGISISGTYPNFTITNSSPSSGGTVTSVAMTVPTGLTVSGTPITSSGTLAVSLQSGYSIPTTASQTNWDAAYNDKINSAAVTGTTTKTLTLTQQDGGTVTASWSDLDSGSITGSGTTNYIPKFTSSSAIGNSVIYESSSNIGIGTTSPSYPLTVISNSSTQGFRLAGRSSDNIANMSFTSNDQNTEYAFFNTGATYFALGTNGSERMRIDASGRLGLGVTPSAWGSGFRAFDFNTLGTLAASSSAVLLQNNSYNNGTNNIRKAIGEASSYSQNGGVHIWETAAFGSSGSTITFSEVMRIAASGNVGIGVSNPDSYNASAYKLVVGGTSTSGITIAGDLEGSGNLYFASGTTGTDEYKGYLTYNHSSDAMTFGTAATTRMTINNAGNVGIGTTSPAVRLESNISGNGLPATSGTTQTNGALRLSSTATTGILDFGLNSANPWIQSTDRTDLSQTYNILLNPRGGNVGIGTTSPGAPLHINNASAHTFIYSTISGASPIALDNSSGNLLIYTASSERMRITSGGNVGIGTTSPDAKLRVSGTASGDQAIFSVVDGRGLLIATSTQGGTTDAGSILNARGAGSGTLIFQTESSERMRITSGGDVLIGQTTNTQGFRFVLKGTNGSTDDFAINTNGSYSEIQTFNGKPLVINRQGNEVYIAGTTDQGAYNLQVNGTGVWGAGAYVNGSDSSLKENIQNMGSALELVNQLQPKTYTYKPSYSKDTTIQVGFIAQDLEQVLGTQIYKNSIVIDGPNFKSVAYQNLIPLLVQSIKELKAEIETLKNK